MKKLALVIAIAMIAAFAAPAMAADVSLSGEYRTLFWYDDRAGGDEATSILQRFRTYVKIKANDNVTAFLRTDFAETTWGNEADADIPAFTKGEGWRRADAAEGSNNSFSTLHVDRAYVQIKSGMFTLQSGQQFGFLGLGTLFDANFFGIKGSFNLKPVMVDLVYSKLDENLALTDEDTADEDEDLYMIQVKYAADGFTAGAIAGKRVDDSTDLDLNAFGLFGVSKMGALTLSGEVDMFSGDTAAGADFEGLQAWLRASFALNDMITLGGDLLYAQGQDDDAQATTLMQFGITASPVEWEGTLGGTTGGFGTARLFDLDGDNNGVMGIIAKVKVMATDAITIWGKVGYAEPEDDSDSLDSAMFFTGEIDYQWMPNVILAAGIEYVDPDEVAGDSDEEYQALFKLGVSF